MQISEEHLAGPQERVFGRLGLLHFHNQAGLLEHGGVIGHHAGARFLILGVRVAGAGAGATLDEHLVAALDQLIRGTGQ